MNKKPSLGYSLIKSGCFLIAAGLLLMTVCLVSVVVIIVVTGGL